MKKFDMLVKLYELPQLHTENPSLQANGIIIRRPMALDKDKVIHFIKTNFSTIWANECDVTFTNTPFSCFVAVKDNQEIIGFSCYDASGRNFFGPIGVKEEYRGYGLGKELLLRTLYAVREQGYAYSIIGMVAEKNAAFYQKSVGAVEIPDSYPGAYKDALGIESWE
ncbi:GNAT family N-acetyltransferase [Paenibacillus tundrae]|uniref:GNAT family N-acetyltransferase n=1 Tax=Paenibacillus tundrae TaxID=528187 RepID=UPI0030CC0AE0